MLKILQVNTSEINYNGVLQYLKNIYHIAL